MEESLEWEHPDLVAVEHRTVNKELEVKRVLTNVILLLVSKLLLNFAKLVLFKLDYTVDYTQVDKGLILFQLLFAWNVVSGLYKVFKPRDDFKDLKLSAQQRELLGLKRVPVTAGDLDQHTPQKTLKETGRVVKATTQQEKSAVTHITSNNNTPRRTPIASPMASQPFRSPIRSPVKSPLKSPLKLQADPLKAMKQITPTYIPSPKYYYRMESPTKSRRRV